MPYLCALILKKTVPDLFSGSLKDIACRFRKSMAADTEDVSERLKDQLAETEKATASLIHWFCMSVKQPIRMYFWSMSRGRTRIQDPGIWQDGSFTTSVYC